MSLPDQRIHVRLIICDGTDLRLLGGGMGVFFAGLSGDSTAL